MSCCDDENCGGWPDRYCCEDCCRCGRISKIDVDEFDADELGLDPEERYDA